MSNWSPDLTLVAYPLYSTGHVLQLGLVVTNSDGANPTMITDNISYDSWDWSPDRNSIAYVTTDRYLAAALMLWNAADTDGTNPVMISDWIRGSRNPRHVSWKWSPDGSRLSWNHKTYPFRCNRLPECTEPNQLWVADADGANPTKIAGFGQDQQGVMRWKWSPDSAYIAAWTDPGDQLWVADANGTNVTRFTDTLPAGDWWAKWSPDGSHIAFTSGSVWVVGADGSNPTKLADRGGLPSPSPSESPWSPDSTHIAYHVKTDDGSYQLRVVGADGSNPTKLADRGGLVSWSPDSTHIVYSVSSTGAPSHLKQLWVADADGSNPTKLADGWSNSLRLRWSPDETHFTFPSWDLDGRGSQVWVAGADGGNPTLITHSVGPAEATWTPNGRLSIIRAVPATWRPKPWKEEWWVSDVDVTNQVRLWAGSRSGDSLGCRPHPSDTHYACNTGNGDIGGNTGRLGFVRADGTILAEFTGFRAVTEFSWSPDGTRVAWGVQVGSHSQLWVADADGSNPTKLTDRNETVDYRWWQPLYRGDTLHRS